MGTTGEPKPEKPEKKKRRKLLSEATLADLDRELQRFDRERRRRDRLILKALGKDGADLDAVTLQHFIFVVSQRKETPASVVRQALQGRFCVKPVQEKDWEKEWREKTKGGAS
jgi:hypothetical protein